MTLQLLLRAQSILRSLSVIQLFITNFLPLMECKNFYCRQWQQMTWIHKCW